MMMMMGLVVVVTGEGENGVKQSLPMEHCAIMAYE